MLSTGGISLFIPNVLIFILSVAVLVFSGSLLVRSLSKIAQILKWNEFVVAFVIMAAATSIPELFVGIDSALNNISELALGTIIGSNVIKLSLAVGLVVLLGGPLVIERATVLRNSLITSVYALLPLLLILDGDISRIDGAVLLLSFLFYMNWLFDARERFTKTYNSYDSQGETRSHGLIKNSVIFVVGALLLVASSEAVILTAKFFTNYFALSLGIVGLLLLGIGTALPEVYFSVKSAISGHKGLILGNLMGGVVVTSSFVLGITALISPIEVPDFSPYAAARLFLLVSTLTFFFFVRTRHTISRKEGVILLSIYIMYLAYETGSLLFF
jgi:cation:H+ antiporter